MHGPAQIAADEDVDVLGLKSLADCVGLREPGGVKRNVEVALNTLFCVPVGFAVSYEYQFRHGWEVRLGCSFRGRLENDVMAVPRRRLHGCNDLSLAGRLCCLSFCPRVCGVVDFCEMLPIEMSINLSC